MTTREIDICLTFIDCKDIVYSILAVVLIYMTPGSSGWSARRLLYVQKLSRCMYGFISGQTLAERNGEWKFLINY